MHGAGENDHERRGNEPPRTPLEVSHPDRKGVRPMQSITEALLAIAIVLFAARLLVYRA